MKNLDIKKLAVFIILILAVVGGIIFISKSKKDKEVEKEETKESENLTINYFANLTQGYSTVYSGIDVLYKNDKTTVEDIEYGAILNTAIKYAQENGINLGVSASILEHLESSGKYGSIKNYTAYDGEKLRNTVKLLFGDVEGTIGAVNSYSYIYDILYVEENDLYLMKMNDKLVNYSDQNYYMDCTLVSQKKVKDEMKTTIAIAYVYNNEGVYTYYKDAEATKEVSNKATEFPTDLVDEFDKYEFTLKKDDSGHYIFKSVEKVK